MQKNISLPHAQGFNVLCFIVTKPDYIWGSFIMRNAWNICFISTDKKVFFVANIKTQFTIFRCPDEKRCNSIANVLRLRLSCIKSSNCDHSLNRNTVPLSHSLISHPKYSQLTYWGHLNIKMLSYQYRVIEDQTVPRPSDTYNGSLHTWKEGLSIETVPRAPTKHSKARTNMHNPWHVSNRTLI